MNLSQPAGTSGRLTKGVGHTFGRRPCLWCLYDDATLPRYCNCFLLQYFELHQSPWALGQVSVTLLAQPLL